MTGVLENEYLTKINWLKTSKALKNKTNRTKTTQSFGVKILHFLFWLSLEFIIR